MRLDCLEHSESFGNIGFADIKRREDYDSFD